MSHERSHLRLCTAVALAGLSLTLASAAEAQSSTLLRLRNPASADRLVVDSAGGVLMGGTYTVGAIPAAGPGTRLMWYPRKAAFRAGYVSATHWDDANVGSYSTAHGYSTRAIGYASTAMGYFTTASESYSTAIGYQTTASGLISTAMGYGPTASGSYSTAMGYGTTASGHTSTAMGYNTTASGGLTTAMGYHASTNGHYGAFVYGDGSTTTSVLASNSNQATWRVAGGFRIYTSSALSSGATLASGGSSWNVVSDQNRKEHFLAVDGEDILAGIRTLPITTWRYLAEEDRSVRHIGPMAQDWHAAFGFSSDSLTINSGDFDGVNLAAVQALDARARDQAERLRLVEAENAELRAAIARHADVAARERSELLLRLERLEARLGPTLASQP